MKDSTPPPVFRVFDLRAHRDVDAPIRGRAVIAGGVDFVELQGPELVFLNAGRRPVHTIDAYAAGGITYSIVSRRVLSGNNVFVGPSVADCEWSFMVFRARRFMAALRHDGWTPDNRRLGSPTFFSYG